MGFEPPCKPRIISPKNFEENEGAVSEVVDTAPNVTGSPMKDKNGTIIDRIIDLMAFVAGGLLVAAVFIVCFEILMRYFVQRPQVWTVEICEYILFGIAFLGAPWLLKKGGHVSIDIVMSRFGSGGQRCLAIFSGVSGALTSAVICYFSLLTAWNSYLSGVVVTKTLTIPKHYFLFMIAFGYFFLFLEFSRQSFRYFRDLSRTDEWNGGSSSS